MFEDKACFYGGVIVFLLVTGLFLVTSGGIEGFYSGDMGVKLWQIKSWLGSEWESASLSFDGTLGELVFRFSILHTPFFIRRGTEFYTIYVNPFVAVAAMLYRWMGPLGLFILPWLGGIAGLLILRAMGRRLGFQHSGLAVAILGIASPWLFYSVAFWEHTLAVALTWAGMLASIATVSPFGAVLGGLLVGAGVILRLELALWAAIWAGYLLVRQDGRNKGYVFVLLLSACIPIALGLLFQYRWTGEWVPLQLKVNLKPEARMFQDVEIGYLSPERFKLSLQQIAGVLMSEKPIKWLLALCYSAQLTALIYRWKFGYELSWVDSAMTYTTLITLMVIALAWKIDPVHASNDLILTMPFLFLLLLFSKRRFGDINLTADGTGISSEKSFLSALSMPSAVKPDVLSRGHCLEKLGIFLEKDTAEDRAPPGNIPLIAISLIFILMMVLVSPNGGGLQWGPRYLLVTSGPLSLAAAEALAWVRESGRRNCPLLITAALAVMLSVVIQGLGLYVLCNHRLCAAGVEKAIPPESVIITDDKGIPYQFIPYLLGERVILRVKDKGEMDELLGELARKNLSEIVYISWIEELPSEGWDAIPRRCRRFMLVSYPVVLRLPLSGG